MTSVEAIILSAKRFRESSKLLGVYTKDFGYCSLIAKGVRNPKSSTAGILEPLSYCLLSFRKKANSDLHTLAGVESIVPSVHITADIEQLTIGLAIAELVRTTHRHEEEMPPLFGHLKNAIIALNSPDTASPYLLPWFLLRLAASLGVEISPLRCGITGIEVRHHQAPQFQFSLREGCVIAPGAMPSGGRIISLEPTELRILQNLSVLDAHQVHKITFPEKYLNHILYCLDSFLAEHIGKSVVPFSLLALA